MASKSNKKSGNKKSSKRVKTLKSAKSKKKRSKMKKSMTTDDLDEIAKRAVSFKNIKKKKIRSSVTFIKAKDIKSNTSPNTTQKRKSLRKLKRCAAITTNIHNKSIEEEYKKKSKRLLMKYNTPVPKSKNSKGKHSVMRSMTLDDLDLDLSYTTLPNESETIETDDEKTAIYQVPISTDENEDLQNEIEKLKKKISELKRTDEMMKLVQQLSKKKMDADNAATIQQIKANHRSELNEMLLTIDGLEFEQKKLKAELDHQNKLHEQKVKVLEADITAKKAVNEQLKSFQKSVDAQLLEQTKITNQIMRELEDVRKNEYIRVPRNNSNVSLKCGSNVSGGCCSSWWGRNRNNMENNMYVKLREGATFDHDSSND